MSATAAVRENLVTVYMIFGVILADINFMPILCVSNRRGGPIHKDQQESIQTTCKRRSERCCTAKLYTGSGVLSVLSAAPPSAALGITTAIYTHWGVSLSPVAQSKVFSS
jgi:hypothetical protein